nr:hypothetical protein [Methanobrevibacter arboriphilus]
MFDMEEIKEQLSEEIFNKIKWHTKNIEGNKYLHGKSDDLICIINEDNEIVELKETKGVIS